MRERIDTPSDVAETRPLLDRTGRSWKIATVLALLLAVALGVGWAVSVVFLPKPAVAEAAFTLVTVENGSVEAARAANVQAVWSRTPIAVNNAAGTVTSVSAQNATPVDAGAVLYAVDLQPVVVLPGAVPSFRDMGDGASGADVAQLQEFLSSHGYLDWFTSGEWESTTTWAVREWQEAAGLHVDGVVGAGEVIFVPSLPMTLALDAEIVRLGAHLNGGEDAVFQLPSSPEFRLPVSSAQAAGMPIGSRVEISAPEGATWDAWIVQQTKPAEGEGVDLVLASSADGLNTTPICLDQCGQIALAPEGVLLRSRVITVEEVTGLVVPSAAITTTADGSTVVIAADGAVHPVEVIAGARGMTVITGVKAGASLRAPAEVPKE